MDPDSTASARGTSENPVRLVALNTAWQIGARVISALIGVVQAAILSHYLHSEGYGQYSFVLAVVGIGSVLTDMGLAPVTVRMFGETNVSHRRQVVGGLLVAKTVLCVAAVAATDLFALVSRVSSVERHGILLMSTLYLVSVPVALTAVFQAELELQYPLVLSTVQTLVAFGLTAFLVVRGAPILALLGAQLLAAGIGSGLLLAVAQARYRVPLRANLDLSAQILRESIPVGVGQALVVLYFRVDAVLLGVIRGPIDVGHYTAAYRFLDLGGFAATAFMGAVYPLMVRMGGDRDRSRLVHAFQCSTEALLFVAVPLAVAIFILAAPIIFLIFPSDFSPSVLALRILSLALVPLFVNNALGSLVLTLHREKTFLWVTVGATGLNIGLNLAFIPSYGITAAAIITDISELFVTVLGLALMGRFLSPLSYRRTPLSILAAAALMGALMYLLRDRWIIAALVGAAAYGSATSALGVWSWRDVGSMARGRPEAHA